MVSKTGNSITIAVASGKGGTGKTFVSTNIFHALAAQGTRVTLADCDAEAPNAAAFFQLNLLENLAVTQQVPVITIPVLSAGCVMNIATMGQFFTCLMPALFRYSMTCVTVAVPARLPAVSMP